LAFQCTGGHRKKTSPPATRRVLSALRRRGVEVEQCGDAVTIHYTPKPKRKARGSLSSCFGLRLAPFEGALVPFQAGIGIAPLALPACDVRPEPS